MAFLSQMFDNPRMSVLVMGVTSFSGTAFAASQAPQVEDSNYQAYLEKHKDDMPQQMEKWSQDQERAKALFAKQEKEHNARIADRAKKTAELEAKRLEVALRAQREEAQRVQQLRKQRCEIKKSRRYVSYNARPAKAHKQITNFSFLRGFFK